jgi:MtN3 and saliva related transmembrane protein
MEMWTMFGLMAGMLTTVGYIPQIVKGYQTKRMNDISLTMPVLLSIGMALWFYYGMVLQDLPIMLWNFIAVCLNLVVILMILRYRQRQTTLV